MLEEALPMSIWVREMLYLRPSRASDFVSPVRADLVEVSGGFEWRRNQLCYSLSGC